MNKYLLPQMIVKGTIDEILGASKNFYSNEGPSDAYEVLMREEAKKNIVKKIRDGEKLTTNEFDTTIGWFLNKWQSHYRYSSTTELISILKKNAKKIKTHFELVSLEKIEDKHIPIIWQIFESIIKIKYINTTITSKILSIIKPDTFIMWDQGIADEYGYAQNPEGYCRFIQIMRDVVITIREFEPNLEGRIEQMGRDWTPPIAKILDEWNIMTKKI